MKSMLALFLGIFCMVCQAQLNQDTIDAMTWRAKTKVTFQVVDSRDSPVTNAQFSVGWSDDYTNRHKEKVAKTDKNGLFVLEASDLDLTTGIEWDWEWTWPPVSANTRRYVWHKQALFKGRSPLYGTTWAGWEFWRDQVDDDWVKVYTQTQANALTANAPSM